MLSDSVPPIPCPTHSRLVTKACRDLSKLSAYTKRLGVLPESFKYVISFIYGKWRGERMSFEARDRLLSDTRLRHWDTAVMCFRGANAIRKWIYDGDPSGRLAEVGFLRSVQSAFERRRRGRRRKAKGATPRKKKETPPAVRRSSRPRKRRKGSPDFHWGWMGEGIGDEDLRVARRVTWGPQRRRRISQITKLV